MAQEPTRPRNPFFIQAIIPDKYFCDRKDDTRNLVSLIENGNNVVLTSERRIGKSSLLHHILGQDAVRGKYNTLYVDVQNTYSAEDFIGAMKLAMADPALSTFPPAFNKKFETATREYGVHADINAGPVSLGAEYRAQQLRKDTDTIEEIFRLLRGTKRPNIIVFDEFQQIEQYADTITPILRSKIQMLPNTRFLFSGSSVHMLSKMFTQYTQPFYGSSTMYGLRRIPAETYADFCHDMFKQYFKDIEPAAVRFAYDLFNGNTLYLQQVMNRVFDATLTYDTATVDTVKSAVRTILSERHDAYDTAFANLRNAGEKRVVAAVAMEGVAVGMTSSAMISKYNLGAPSTVHNHLTALSSENNHVLQKIGDGAYVLVDKFLELWIADRIGVLSQKFDNAAALRALYEKKCGNRIPVKGIRGLRKTKSEKEPDGGRHI